MKNTKAKFYCTKNEVVNENEHAIGFSAVIDGSEENERFFSLTPSGQLELQVVNQKTAENFEVGQEYYLTISPVEK